MNLKSLIYWCCLFIGLLFFHQFFYAYHFFYTESFQLFLFTPDYASTVLSSYGGLSTYIARFFIQFYAFPLAGAAITSFLLLSITFALYWVLKRVGNSQYLFLLSFIPTIYLIPLQLDINYKQEATIALLLSLISFIGYLSIKKPGIRIITACLLSPLLLFTSGSGGLLFSMFAFFYELKMNRKYLILGGLPIIEVIITAYLLQRTSVCSSLSMSLLPDLYYDPKLHEPAIYYPWIASLVVFLLVYTLLQDKEQKTYSRTKKNISLSIQFLLICSILTYIKMTDDKEVRIYEKQLFFLRNGDWENIIANHTVQQSSIARLNPILNLALAKKNMLGEKLFDYRPSGVIDLLPQWDNTMDHASLLSDVYYQIGDIATAQKMAFEASVSSINGGSGYLMKRLVETNIIFGAYPVAEKYISILEKTLCYKSFATSCRPLLYNDTTVAKHPQFGSKRQALRKDCQYAVSSKVIQTLEQLAVNNPENRTPMHYLAAMCLLNKDKATFKRLIESYYNTSVWPQLSTLHQQAVVTLEQNNQKYWIQHGASMKVEQDFYGFNDAAKEKQHTPFFQKEMETLFGNTYWFYLLFNK